MAAVQKNTISQSIQQFAYQAVLNQRASPDEAVTQSTETVAAMLEKATALAAKHGTDTSVVYHAIQQFTFHGLGEGKVASAAVAAAVTTVDRMLGEAAEIAKKFQE